MNLLKLNHFNIKGNFNIKAIRLSAYRERRIVDLIKRLGFETFPDKLEEKIHEQGTDAIDNSGIESLFHFIINDHDD